MLKNLDIRDVEECPIALRSVDVMSEEYNMLKRSIAKHGVLSPISVRLKLSSDNKTVLNNTFNQPLYQVVDGLHRLIAARQLNRTHIPCNIVNYTDAELEVVQLMSSKHRVPTKPYEYHKGLLRIISRNTNLVLTDLCDQLGMDFSILMRMLHLDSLCVKAKKYVINGEISLINAHNLNKIRPVSSQEHFINNARFDLPIKFADDVRNYIRDKRNVIRAPLTQTKENISMAREFLEGKQVRKFLGEIPRGNFFTVIFEKADGSLREMTGRRDVRKHLKGGESTIADKKYLQSLYDTSAKDYRCFNTNKVLMLRGEGYELRVREFDSSREKIERGNGETKPRFANSNT